MARNRIATSGDRAARPLARILVAGTSRALTRGCGALAAILVAGALPAAAAAHTHLASTSPSDGARTRVAPAAVVLRFTQPVDARTAVLRVVDERGSTVPIATRAGSDGVVRVALRRALANGDYAVGYRVLADDGHAMRGGIAFTVAARAEVAGPSDARADPAGGAVAADGGGLARPAEAAGAADRGRLALVRAAVPGDAAWTRPALVAARGGQYAGLVLALGGVTFLLLAWWPALGGAARPRRDPAAATWRRTLAVAIAIGGATAAAGLVAHAFDAAGAQPTGDRVLGGLGDHAGVLWIEATACWALAAWLLGRAARLSPHHAKRLLAPLAGALLATALAGHGATGGDPLAAAAAIVHGAAAAIWIGALAWLMLAARGGEERRRERAAILPGAAARVSRLSLAAALATLGSGAIQAIALAGGPLTLPSSSYGRLVLVKLALFAGLVALGAVHRRRALPALHRRTSAVAPATARPLRATLRAELLVAALVLTAAGALTASSPPRGADAAPRQAALAASR